MSAMRFEVYTETYHSNGFADSQSATILYKAGQSSGDSALPVTLTTLPACVVDKGSTSVLETPVIED